MALSLILSAGVVTVGDGERRSSAELADGETEVKRYFDTGSRRGRTRSLEILLDRDSSRGGRVPS
jgi:hypothetical protein